MSVAFTTIQSAIRAWVVAATGLASGQVLWANQGHGLPSGTYATLRLLSTPVGRGWLNYTDDPGGDPGEELIEEHESMVQLELQIQLIDGDATGNSQGANLLLQCQKYAQFSSQRELFTAAGWAPARWGTIQDVPAVVGSQGPVFEPRSVVSCFGYASASLLSTATYIEFAEITNEVPTPDSEFTLDLINQEVT